MIFEIQVQIKRGKSAALGTWILIKYLKKLVGICFFWKNYLQLYLCNVWFKKIDTQCSSDIPLCWVSVFWIRLYFYSFLIRNCRWLPKFSTIRAESWKKIEATLQRGYKVEPNHKSFYVQSYGQQTITHRFFEFDNGFCEYLPCKCPLPVFQLVFVQEDNLVSAQIGLYYEKE